MNNRKNIFIKSQEFKNFLLIFPFMMLVFIFSYLPLYGWIYAFYNYIPGMKLSDCEFTGLKFFTMMFADEIQRTETIRVLKNTFGISFISLMTTPLSVIFALFLVEIKVGWFKKIVQTMTTLPNFLSWVLVYAFAFAMFSTDDGFVNRVLISLHLISEPINFLASDNNVWLTQIGYGIWKGLGWSAIIYLATISSIDNEMYEAAEIDGAGRFSVMWHITVPCLMPTYFVMLLLSIANFLNNGVQQFYVFQNAINKDYIEVLDLYVYNVGLKNGMSGFNYSFSTAIGILKSLVSVSLLFVVNFLSVKVRNQKIV
jgi:putative aldouronate transport system permease protein